MTLHAQAKRPKSPPVLEWERYLGEQTTEVKGVRRLRVSGAQYEAWPTLVLGSGCTSTESQFASLDALPKQLANAVSKRPSSCAIDGQPLGELVGRFAERLVADRAHRCRPPIDGSEYIFKDTADDAPLWPWLVELVVAATLMSKLYYQIKARGNDAPLRSDHDEMATLDRAGTSWTLLDSEYVQPCAQALESISAGKVANDLSSDEEGSRDAVRRTVEALLAGWKAALNPSASEPLQIRLLDMQALAEFTWFCLTAKVDESALYPGWSDMLLDLSNHDGTDTATCEGRVGVPMFTNVNSAADLIRDRYWRITTKSLDHPNDFFQTIATLLNTQYDIYTKLVGEAATGNRPGQSPQATAFVTSFDIELELALLREGQPFALAFPVNVVVEEKDGHDRVIQTCWLALQVPATGDVSAKERLDDIHQPSGHLSIFTASTRIEGPLVVHLAGCPLVELPKLSVDALALRDAICEICREELDSVVDGQVPRTLKGSELRKFRDETAVRVKERMRLWHAIILNEHDGVIQSALDLLPENAAYGLPSRVAQGEAKYGWNRYWMLLGVQMRDSAIRQRIATLVSSLPHNGANKLAEYGSVNSTGVAINSRLAELEKDLLFWSGFDVVRGDVTQAKELLGDLAKRCASFAPQGGESSV